MTHPVNDAPAIGGMVLEEARELRRKQDARLRGLQALSRSMLAGYLSAGLIALASRHPDAEVSRSFSLAIIITAAALVIVAILVEFSAGGWKEGPDIEALSSRPREASTAVRLDTHLARLHDDHRGHNEKSLARAKRFVALQVYGTLGGGAILLALLLE